MIDPMVALKSFQKAYSANDVVVHTCELDKQLQVHLDRPAGEPRYTYARISPGKAIKAVAIFTMADPHEGLPVFQVGYATAQTYRKKGLAKDVVAAGIAELKNGLGRNGLRAFYVEAIVGMDNVGSQKVAEAVISKEPVRVTDRHSGKPALQFLRRVG
jgi:RimJ/RimL family protein N-acetyltransferase